jgi:hypothetical protein
MRGRGAYEDIEKLPEHLIGELIDGELIVSPRPRPRHALASSMIGGQLLPFARRRGAGGPGGWWIKVAPDWVCEVLSPSSARVDRIRKLPIYAKSGVDWAWVVDASNETIEVLRRDGEHWIIDGTVGGREPARLAPFGETELDLSLVWEAGA